MNLKKSLMGTVAGLALVGSLAAPVVAGDINDDTTNNTAPVTVYVGTTGAFDASFSGGISFSDANFQAGQSNTVKLTGDFNIHYLDTYVDRPSFDLYVRSTAFVNQDGAGSIPASAFTIVGVENVRQDQWGGVTGPLDPKGPNADGHGDIGDIGQFVNDAYVDQSTLPQPWTPEAYSFSDWRKLQFGYAGVGTITSDALVHTQLAVPPTTPTGHYLSTLTLTVVAGTQP